MKLTKNKIILSIPLIITLISVLILTIQAYSIDTVIMTGLVETTEIDIASKIPGRIENIYVREGEAVTKGQLIANLESKEIDAKVGQARGVMQAAAAKLEMARNGARPEEREAVEKMYMQAVHQYDLAEKTWKRVESVYKDSVISTQERDQVEFQYKAAREQMDAARAKYDMVKKGARQEEIAAAGGLFLQAQSAVQEALAYQEETRLISPISGEVSARITDPGEIIAAGYPVFSVTDTSDVWVVLQIREDMMSFIKKDLMVKGEIPALGMDSADFRVSHIATMADFATWRATNQKGDFDLKTFEIHLRPSEKITGLRAGMTVRLKFIENN